jgi:hypothetical protein
MMATALSVSSWVRPATGLCLVGVFDADGDGDPTCEVP